MIEKLHQQKKLSRIFFISRKKMYPEVYPPFSNQAEREAYNGSKLVNFPTHKIISARTPFRTYFQRVKFGSTGFK